MFGAKFYKEKLEKSHMDFETYADFVTQKFIGRFNAETSQQTVHAKIRVVNFSVKIEPDKQGDVYAYCEIYYDITN